MAGIAYWLGTQVKQNCQWRSQATRLALQVGRSSGWNPLGHPASGNVVYPDICVSLSDLQWSNLSGSTNDPDEVRSEEHPEKRPTIMADLYVYPGLSFFPLEEK